MVPNTDSYKNSIPVYPLEAWLVEAENYEAEVLVTDWIHSDGYLKQYI